MGKYIDLHIHSNMSDGKLTPKEIYEKARENNVGEFSITDHDDIMSISEIRKLGEIDIIYIPGIEISTQINFNGKEKYIHILGYGIDGDNDQLNDMIITQKEIRRKCNKQYLENMVKTFHYLSQDMLESIDCVKYMRFSRVIEQYLNDQRFTQEQLLELKKYLLSVKNIYPNYNIPEKKAIETILNSGGYPVLAHPYQYMLDYNDKVAMIEYLRGLGLVGIETIHSGDTKEGMEEISRICQDFKMFSTAGSDFHTDINDNGREIGLGINKNLCVEECTLNKVLRLNEKVY